MQIKYLSNVFFVAISFYFQNSFAASECIQLFKNSNKIEFSEAGSGFNPSASEIVGSFLADLNWNKTTHVTPTLISAKDIKSADLQRLIDNRRQEIADLNRLFSQANKRSPISVTYLFKRTPLGALEFKELEIQSAQMKIDPKGLIMVDLTVSGGTKKITMPLSRIESVLKGYPGSSESEVIYNGPSGKFSLVNVAVTNELDFKLTGTVRVVLMTQNSFGYVASKYNEGVKPYIEEYQEPVTFPQWPYYRTGNKDP